MSDSIIKVEGLGKKYIIAHEGKERYTALRDVISRGVKKMVKKRSSLSKEEFWALKDVNFEVKRGEAIGIIGRNGAGKSTLLKVLSRITEPTHGRIEVNGRIASLLEVGTGFHPELTGRENIYLNGAILGMSRQEIKKKFDEIVAFSGVEKFLDTPVKKYSSGMYVRLAFSVAAHLEPEILIVDEVLAVGDAEFQKKCLGKMNDVSTKEGRTVLFVSHQMGTIAQLCSSTFVMNSGQLMYSGPTSKAIDYYTENNTGKVEVLQKEVTDTKSYQFLNVYSADSDKKYKHEYRHDEPVNLFTGMYLPNVSSNLELAVSLYDKNKRRVFTIHEPLSKYAGNSNQLELLTTIPPHFLTPGHYSWLMCFNAPGVGIYDVQDDICPFSIIDTGSDFAAYESADYGCVFPVYQIKNTNQ